MYDPLTVAFTIKSPFRGRLKDGRIGDYRPSLVTIWHCDPESDGSDDSCGWHNPPKTELDRKVLDNLVREDESSHYFRSSSILQVIRNPEYSYHELMPGDALALTAAAWQLVAKEKAHLSSKDHGGWKRVESMTAREWWYVVQLSLYPHDNLRSAMNDDDPDKRVRSFFNCVLRAYNRFHRPWYRHPRWHIHHWQIQIHPVQDFKRWAFSRCNHCGRGFSWGYCPVSDGWGGTGPTWFSSEKGVYHSDCRNPAPPTQEPV